MNYNTVEYIQNEISATIVLNRPEKYNAFNAEMIVELTGAVINASTNTTNRYLLIKIKGMERVLSFACNLSSCITSK